MAYSRFGWDGSDVYVYFDVGGYLCCCACFLGDNWKYESTDEMIAHLEEHKKAGHTVPDTLIPDLLEDKESNDNWINKFNYEIDHEVQNASNNRVPFFRDVEGRFSTTPGWKGVGETRKKVWFHRELSPRKHIGDRASFFGSDSITFDSLETYITGYTAVVDRIKKAIDVSNAHYGTNNSYTKGRPLSFYAIGTRVAAVLKADNEQVHLLGYGIYDGDFTPPIVEEVTAELLGEEKVTEEQLDTLKESKLYHNPRITLDNGDTVWGYQCWWAPEDGFKEWVDDREIIEASVKDLYV